MQNLYVNNETKRLLVQKRFEVFAYANFDNNKPEDRLQNYIWLIYFNENLLLMVSLMGNH